MKGMKSTTAIGLAFAVLLQSTAWSQAQPPLKPANSQTRLDVTPAGTPIVNIATPRSDGTSYNVFERLDVRREGLIFNNSATIGPSAIGGQILANPNLIKAGSPAQLIINEVIGGSRSDLGGVIEVFGQPAGLVIANMAGITCDGCGFINIPRVTLATGKVVFGQNGAFAGFDVRGGDVLVEGAGLLAGNVDYFDIVTASAKANADLYARDLSIVGGQGEYNYATHEARGRSADQALPRIAIDTSLLGGMYANRIRLIGSGAGVGINLSGTVAALEGGLEITGEGDIRVSKAVAASDARLSSRSGSISIADQLYSGGSADLDGERIALGGLAAAAGDLTIRAKSDVLLGTSSLYAGLDDTGSLGGTGKVSISAGGTIDAPGAILGATSGLGLSAPNVNLGRDSELFAPEITIAVQGQFVGAGRIESQQALALSGRQLELGGIALTNGGLSIDGGSIAISGAVAGIGSVAVKADARLVTTTTGRLESNGALSVVATALDNAGKLSAGGTVLVSAAARFANSGSILSGRNIALGAADFTQSGTIVANGTLSADIDGHGSFGGSLAAGEALRLSARSLDLSGALNGVTAILASAQDSMALSDAATLLSDGSIGLSSGTSLSVGGRLSSSRGVSLSGGTRLALSGSIVSAGAITASAEAIASTADLIGDDGIRLYATRGPFDLGGAISTAASLRLEGAAPLTISGTAVANGSVGISANALTITGRLSSKRDIEVRTSDLAEIAARGSVEALGSVAIHGGAIRSAGLISGVAALDIHATREAELSGIAQSSGALALIGSNVVLSGRIIGVEGLEIAAREIAAGPASSLYSGGALTLRSDRGMRLSGDIAANGALSAESGGWLNASGRIASLEHLQISALAALDLDGSVESGRALSLRGGSIGIRGQLTVLGKLDARATDPLISFASSSIRANDGVLLSASHVGLSGLVASAAELAVSGSSIDVSGRLEAGRSLSLRSAADLGLGASSAVLSGGVLSLSAGTGLQAMGRVAADGTISLDAGDTLAAGGRLDGGAALSLTSRVAMLSGQIAVDGALEIETSGLLDANGTLSTLGAASISAGDVRIGSAGSLAADKRLSVDAGSIANAGSIAANGEISLQIAGRAANTGRISGGGDYRVSTGSDFSSDGSLNVNGILSVAARDVRVSGSLSGIGGLELEGRTLTFEAGSDLRSGGGTVLSASGSILLGGALASVGAAHIGAGADLTIGGTLQTGGPTSIEAFGALHNRGFLSSVGSLGMTGGSIVLDGTSVSNADLSVRSSSSLMVAGTLSSVGALSLDSATSSLGGLIVSDSSVLAKAVNLELSGTISGRNATNISANRAARIAANAIVLSGGNVSAIAGDTLDLGGSIRSDLGVDLRATEILLSGDIETRGDLALSASAKLASSGAVSASQGLAISAQAAELGGSLIAARDVSVDASTLLVRGLVAGLSGIDARTGSTHISATAALEANGAITLSAVASLSNEGRILSTGTIDASAAHLSNAGSLVSNGRLGLTGGLTLESSGSIASGGAMTLRGRSVSITGLVNGTGDVSITGEHLSLGSAARIFGSSHVALASLADLFTAATIDALGSVSVGGGALLEQTGTIRSDSDLSLSGIVVRNSGSLLESGRNLNLTGQDIVSSGAVRAVRNASLQSGGDISLSGSIQAGADLEASAGATLSSSGLVSAAGRLTLNAQRISLAGSTYGERDSIARATGALDLTSSGSVGSGSNLNIAAAALTNAGKISSGGALSVSARDMLTNVGAIYGAGRTGVDAAGLIQSGAGSTQSGGALSLSVANSASLAGLTAAGGTLDLTAGSIDANGIIRSTLAATLDARRSLTAGEQASIATGGDLFIRSGDSLTSVGRLYSSARTTLASGGALTLRGELDSFGSVNIAAVDAAFGGHLATGGALSAKLDGHLEVSNDLVASGPISLEFVQASLSAQSRLISDQGIALGGTGLSTAGRISAAGLFDVRGESIELGGLLASGGGLTVTASGTVSQTGAIETDGSIALTAREIVLNGNGIALEGLSSQSDTLSIAAGAKWQSGNGIALTAASAAKLAGEFSATGTVDIAAGTTLAQSGRVWAGGSLSLHGGVSVEHEGRSEAGGPLLLSAGSFRLNGSLVSNDSVLLESGAGIANIAGTVSARKGLVATFGTDATISGIIAAGGPSIISGSGGLNVIGTVSSAGETRVTTSKHFDLPGTIASGSAVAIRAGALDLAGSVAAGAGLDISTQTGGATLRGNIDASRLSVFAGGGNVAVSETATIDVASAASIESTHDIALAGRFATGGNVSIAASNIRLDSIARISTNGGVDVRSSDSFLNDAALSALGPISISANDVRTGRLSSNSSIVISSANALAVDGDISALGDITVSSTSGQVAVGAGIGVLGGGALLLKAGTGVSNQGLLGAAGLVELRASGLLSSSGSIVSDRDSIRLTAAEAQLGGQVFSEGGLSIDAGSLFVSGAVAATGNAEVAGGRLIVSGLLQSGAGIAIGSAETFVHGTIQAQGHIKASGRQLIVQQGATIEGGSVDFAENEIVNKGRLAANGSLTLRAARIDTTGSIFSAADANLTADHLVLAGTLESARSANLAGGQLDFAARGRVRSIGALSFSGDALDLAGSGEAGGQISIGSRATLTASGALFGNAGATIDASGEAFLHGAITALGSVGIVAGSVRQDGTIVANGAVSLQSRAGAISINGRVDSAGLSFDAIDGAVSIGTNGDLRSGADIQIAGTSLGNMGTIAALGTIRGAAAGPIVQGGRVLAGRGVALTANTVFTNAGTIDAASISLSANSLGLGGALRSSDAIELHGFERIAIDGTIDADGAVSIGGNSGLFEFALAGTGRISSSSRVSINNARNIDLAGALVAASSSSDVSISFSDAASLTGRIDAGRDVTIVGQAGTASRIGIDGHVAGGRNLGLTAGTLDVRGDVGAGNDIAISLSGGGPQNGLSLDLRGNILAGRDIAIESANGIATGNTASLASGRNLAIAAGGLLNDGEIAAGRSLTISTLATASGLAGDGALRNNGLIQAGGPVSLSATTGFTNAAGGRLVSDVSVSVVAGDIAASGRINAGDLIAFTTGSASIDGLVQSGRRVAIDAGRATISAAGRIEALGQPQPVSLAPDQFGSANLAIRTVGALSNAGTLHSEGSIALQSSSASIDLRPGSGLSARGTAIFQALSGDVTIAPEGIISAASLGVFQGHDFVNTSNRTFNGDLLISAPNISNQGALLGAGGMLTLRAGGTIANGGGTIFAGDALNLEAGSGIFNTSGSLLALGSLTLQAPTIDNASSRIESLGSDIHLTTTQLTNRILNLVVVPAAGGTPGADIVVENSGAGQIVAARDIAIDAPGGTITNSNSTILAGRDISVRAGVLNNIATLVQTISEQPVYQQIIVHRIEDAPIPCPPQAIPGTCRQTPRSDGVTAFTFWDEYDEIQVGTQLVTTQAPLPTIIQASRTLSIEAGQINNGTIANGQFVPTGTPIPGVGAPSVAPQAGLSAFHGPATPGVQGLTSPDTPATSNGPTSASPSTISASSSFGVAVSHITANAKGADGARVSAEAAAVTNTIGPANPDVSTAIAHRDEAGALARRQIAVVEDVAQESLAFTVLGAAVASSGNAALLAAPGNGTPVAASLAKSAQASSAGGPSGLQSLQMAGATLPSGVAVLAMGLSIDVAPEPISQGAQFPGARNSEAQGSGFAGSAIPGIIGASGKAGRFVFDFLRSFNLVASNGGFDLGSGGLFTFNSSPDAAFLFSTAASFADNGSLFDSDYFFDRLDIDRDTHFTRLGDGFFEAQLISQQVRSATQAAQLAQFGSSLEQAAGLMQAGLDNQRRLGLSPGIALSESQVQNLTSSIVWWVGMNVAGRDVLVPVLYLAASDRKQIANGAILGGDTVALKTTGEILNGGTIRASGLATITAGGSFANGKGASVAGGDVVIRAASDIVNRAATISGNNVALAAGRDILLDGVQTSTSTSAFDTLGKGRFTSASQSSVSTLGSTIESRGNLSVSAGRDLTVSASSLKSGGDAALSAGRDVTLTGVDEGRTTSEAWKLGKKTFGTSTATETHFAGSSITTGGNLRIEASNILSVAGSDLAAKGNVALSAIGGISIAAAEERASGTLDERKGKKTVTSSEASITHRFSTIGAGGSLIIATPGAVKIDGAELASGGQASVAAGSISVSGAIDSASFDSATKVKKSGLASKKVTTTTISSDQQTVVASTIGGGRVTLQSMGDTVVKASNIVSDNGTAILAGGTIDIGTLAAKSSESESIKVKKSGISISGGGLFAGVAKATNATTQETVTHSGSLVGAANGNVTLSAAKALTITGSQVATPGTVTLAGESVTIQHATDTADTTSLAKSSSFGLSIKVKSPVVDAVKSVARLADIATGTPNARVAAVSAVAGALAVKNGVDAVNDAAGTLVSGKGSLGVTLSASLGFSKSKATSETHSETIVGSSVGGGTVTIAATGVGKAGSVSVIGSDLVSKGNTTILANGDVRLQAATETDTQGGQSKSSGASIGVSAGIGLDKAKGATSGTLGLQAPSLNIGLSSGKSSYSGTDVSNREATLKAGGIATIGAPAAVALDGATISANRVVIDAGSLSIVSRQDGSTFQSKEKSIGLSASASLGGAVSVGVNVGAGKQSGDFASVAEQAGVFAGKGGFEVRVAGATDLKGAVIASEAGAVQNRLETGTLTASDLQNREAYKATSVSVGFGIGANLGKDNQGNINTDGSGQPLPGIKTGIGTIGATPPVALSASGKQVGVTQSAIAPGAIVVASGEAASLAAAAGISRDTAAANNGALTQAFTDAKRDEIAQGFEASRQLANQLGTFFANRASEEAKLNRQADEAEAKGNSAEATRLRTEAAAINTTYSAGSPVRILATALAGAAGSNVTGSLGSLVQGAAVNALQSLAVTEVKKLVDGIADPATREATRAALQAVTACAGAASSGNCASAATGAAASVALNNLLSTGPDTAQDKNGKPLTLEEQQARTNLIGSLVTAIANGAGLNPATATNAANIETENNGLAPNFVRAKCDPALPNCFTNEELVAKNKAFIDAGLMDGKAFLSCLNRPGNEVCSDGRTLALDKLAGADPSARGLFASLSDQELANRYLSYENLKLEAFLAVNSRSHHLLNYFEANPGEFQKLSQDDKATITLAYLYKQENYFKALLASGPFEALGSLEADFQLSTRTAGISQAVFGGIGAITSFAGAAAASPACVTLAGCAPTVGLGAVGIIEVDQAVAGVRTAINGAPVNSLAAQGLSTASGGALTADQFEIVIGGASFAGSIVGGKFVAGVSANAALPPPRFAAGIELNPKLPAPVAGIDYTPTRLTGGTEANQLSQIRGYQAELQLANRIADLPGETVVRYGSNVNTSGADVISVSADGTVTLWDSKFLSSPSSIKPSTTFGIENDGSFSTALSKALAQAKDAIMDAKLPQATKDTALMNLRAGNFRTITAGEGSVRNSIPARICNRKPCGL